ncbi:hypothetical protein QN277_010622 [Acacia crassicarpa]|uniref:Uncharacterized protein n=1 Tax=Acacia crassicarpa TaxID=499986 RepID=A0AAE1M681_9FABA|nr:hypothetical protein QN277_010622 [Acacia crassicarpa]
MPTALLQIKIQV